MTDENVTEALDARKPVWHPLSPNQVPQTDFTSYFSNQLASSPAHIFHDNDATPKPSAFVRKGSKDQTLERLVLPLAPHRMQEDQLEDALLVASSHTAESQGSQLPVRFVTMILCSLSRRLEELEADNTLAKASSAAEKRALLGLLQSDASSSAQDIDRVLVRALNEARDGVIQHMSEAHDTPFELHVPKRAKSPPPLLDRRDTASIHSAVEEAMSVNISSNMPTRPSQQSPKLDSQDKARPRNSSLSFRLFGGLSSQRNSVASSSKLPEIVQDASDTVQTPVSSPDEQPSPTVRTDPDSDLSPATPRKGHVGLSDWAGTVLGWSGRKSPKGAKATSLGYDNTVAQPKTRRSSVSTSSSSSASATMQNSTYSFPTSAPTIDSISSAKSTAVTALISKQSINSAAISIPVDAPFPSLSNPASVQPSPMAPSFSDQSRPVSTKAFSILSEQQQDLLPIEGHPSHFEALTNAAERWVSTQGAEDQPGSNRKVFQMATALIATVADEQGIVENHIGGRPNLARSKSQPDTNATDVPVSVPLTRQASDQTGVAQKSTVSHARHAIGRALGLSKGRSPIAPAPFQHALLGASSKPEPTVTLPTLNLTRQGSVFQAAMSMPTMPLAALTNGSSQGINQAAYGGKPVLDNVAVEMDAIGSEIKPPGLTVLSEAAVGMEALVDRYGFMHEKHGIKLMRDQKRKQGDASLEQVDEGPNSIKRLLSQLDDNDEGRERIQQNLWEDYIKRRRQQNGQSISNDSPLRKQRGSVLLTVAKLGPAALAASTDDGGAEDFTPSQNLVGIARMGTSGKTGKEAFKELKKLIRAGVPPSYRPSIWAELSGASEQREPGYFQNLLQKNSADADSMSLKQINADVSRTFGSNVFFAGDGPGVAKLRRVLIAYSWHNPEVGYCQGMNLVAGTLLLALPTEEDAFWVLTCIIERILPSDYYTSTLLVSRADQNVLKELVERELPLMHAHLAAHGVELETITFGWFLSLYSMCLPIQTLLRVLDLFFCDGVIVLFRVALAIFDMNMTEILATQSASDLMMYLRSLAGSMHQADRLVKAACDNYKDRVKTKDVNKLRQKYADALKGEMP